MADSKSLEFLVSSGRAGGGVGILTYKEGITLLCWRFKQWFLLIYLKTVCLLGMASYSSMGMNISHNHNISCTLSSLILHITITQFISLICDMLMHRTLSRCQYGKSVSSLLSCPSLLTSALVQRLNQHSFHRSCAPLPSSRPSTPLASAASPPLRETIQRRDLVGSG